MSVAAAQEASAAPKVRRYSREDIVRLGQAGRPWEFLPVVSQALEVAPDDAGLRVLAAANLAKLGLVTAAREQLERLPELVAKDQSLAGLWTLITGAKADRIPGTELLGTCRGNVARLAERGVDVSGELAGFEARIDEWEWFKTTDGNIVRRHAAETPGTRRVWLGLGDHRGFAERFAREKLGKGDPKDSLFTVEGVDPPWLLMQVAAATARHRDGFWPRLLIVQEDPREFLEGLAQADLPLLGEERTSVFVGPGASAKLGAWLAGRMEFKITGPMAAGLTVRTRCEPGVPRVLMGAEAEQEREHERLAAEVAEVYAGRDKAWWRERYGAAASKEIQSTKSEIREPLRVLIPTSRFSTFIKHSARDLAEAFEAVGCEARLLAEPDDCTRLASIAWLRTLAEFKPDLVVLINHMRASIGEWVPAALPFVTWIQDAMPHQFDAELGRKQTEWDFLVGHLHEEMFASFGFPRGRTLAAPVVASEVKFHAGTCDAGLLKEHACEMALVSHHGEPPRAMHERLVAEAGGTTATARTVEAIWPRLVDLVEGFGRDPMGVALQARVAAIAEEETERGLGAGDRARALILRTYALPVADRLLRHQTVGWAAELARERGWRLRLCGRGWEATEGLREFARPEVGHGEELRACYRGAAAHLHVSIHALAHQRVMECALSGGLPVCRVIPELVLRPLRMRAAWAAAVRGEPVREDRGRGMVGYEWTAQPEGAEYAALVQKLGLPLEPVLWVSARKRESWRARPEWRPPEPDAAAWLLGDIGALTFASKEKMGETVGAAIADGRRRAALSAAIAGRVRERYTHGKLVREVLGLVGGELGVTPFCAGEAPTGAVERSIQDSKSKIRHSVVGLIAPHGVSGVSSAMARLAGARGMRHPWRVLAVGQAPVRAEGLPGADTPGFSTLSWPAGARPVELVRAVRDRLRVMGATVVSPNFLVQGFVAAALDRHRGRRVAALFHGSELAAEDLYQRVAPLCNAWRAVSPAIARRVARYTGAEAPAALPTGTEIPEKGTRLPCVRSRHEPLRLLYAGWLDDRVKRVMDLVKLADGLHGEGVDFRLTIAGRGPASGKLASAMAGHIVEARVLLAGAVAHAEMDRLYRDHDVLVLVSQMEGTPTVVMEAMARARPVAITSGCGGALEAVRDGAEGVVVEVGDMHTLARKLANLNARRGDLAKMGERARLGALENFDIRALGARFDELVEEAAAAESGPAANDAVAIAGLWSRVLGAFEYLGESTPAELCGLLLEWLVDLGATAVLHAAEGIEALGPALGAGGAAISGVAGPAGPRWMGWSVVRPDDVEDGSLVITASPRESRRAFGERGHLLPLVLPRGLNLASRRAMAALEELRERGCSRVVLYGAGKHTRKLAHALERAPEVVAIIDDRAGHPDGPPARLWGFPVLRPADAAKLGFDAVIVSSDEHERVMMARAREWAGDRSVVALYAPIERPGGEIPEALIATSPRA